VDVKWRMCSTCCAWAADQAPSAAALAASADDAPRSCAQTAPLSELLQGVGRMWAVLATNTERFLKIAQRHWPFNRAAPLIESGIGSTYTISAKALPQLTSVAAKTATFRVVHSQKIPRANRDCGHATRAATSTSPTAAVQTTPKRQVGPAAAATATPAAILQGISRVRCGCAGTATTPSPVAVQAAGHVHGFAVIALFASVTDVHACPRTR